MTWDDDFEELPQRKGSRLGKSTILCLAINGYTIFYLVRMMIQAPDKPGNYAVFLGVLGLAFLSPVMLGYFVLARWVDSKKNTWDSAIVLATVFVLVGYLTLLFIG